METRWFMQTSPQVRKNSNKQLKNIDFRGNREQEFLWDTKMGCSSSYSGNKDSVK